MHSCVENSGGGSKSKSDDSGAQSGGTTGSTPTGPGAGPSDSDLSGTSSDLINSIKVDLRHVIDPFDGTYKTKVTIPKNYKGLLYFSGLNVTTLKSKFVYVRLRFGRDKTEFILPAVPGKGSGITPQTDVDLLIVDLEEQPFKKLRLLHQLYDYNDYDSDDDGIEFGANDSPNTPTNDVRNSGLYCRGVNLEDDPTFSISTSNNQCDQAGEVCLYTYAKIGDSGLYDNAEGSFLTPTKEQVDDQGAGYTSLGQATYLKHCLSDIDLKSDLETSLQTTVNASNVTTVAYADTAFAGSYVYYGPYRRFNHESWQISGDAIFSPMRVAGTTPTGLFQLVLDNAPADSVTDPSARAAAGIKSFLFPRAGKTSYSLNKQYIGYTDLNDALGDRAIRTLLSGTETEYVDGCNLRVTRPSLNTCEVTATVEIVTRDSEDDAYTVISTSNKVKLQLSEESESDFYGNEVQYNAVRRCDNSNSCGSNECCYNNRCWSKDLVSQCKEDVSSIGDLLTGQTCEADTQCASLCCGDNRTCIPHNPDDTGGASCNKVAGQKCITSEFCAAKSVNKCQVVKTGGVDASGNPACRLNCYRVEINGDCINGTCREASDPIIPIFNEADPNRCDNAIDPPFELN